MAEVVSPIDARVLARVAPASPDEVHAAVRAARAAQPAWARRTGSERGRILHAVADLIEAAVEELAETETRNTGKILSDTRREARRAAGSFRYYAGWAEQVRGETIPVGAEYHTYTAPEPHGVVAGVIPWNVPFFFAAKKIAPALAFGNACLLKPAEETPLTALRLAGLLTQAGVPEELVAVLPGGRETGAALVSHPDVDLIVFTGHHDTGKAIARAAAEHLTPVALELGGKSPQVVFGDADLDRAVDAVVLGVFASCGQMCIAGSRLVVHESVYDEVLDRIAERVRGLRVGDPFDQDTDLGPQITSAQRDKTAQFIAETRSAGRLVAQAALPDDERLRDGFYVPPTVFDRLDAQARLLREEVFGPVLAVSSFRDDAEALRLADDTDFGLAAGVWTADIARAHRFAGQVRAGTVWINTYRVLSDLVPFGGVGLSGYGRENGTEAARLYLRPKSVWTSLAAGTPQGYGLGGAGAAG
ncbi:aldehyde dehydrogenase family protein [Micromonospora craniellae]|uniref:Aldehyde dehydrogenase family protein n=1 Tax=Micromonospora craniellae TaxID=2294034 RepID=A0A372G222_9ACTN|nr:aldehyde dehydrogenase family protein [Micromonospora craniellae]QOC91860.1 aldehyde dehydrogenase family protein [Micromonospora craniellae]RFS46799.1 aldehyde dehydrogenase family protein [Micromonospora craniellae]